MTYFFYAFDLMMALILFLTGRFFYCSNGGAWRHIAGYNTKGEEERRQYDEVRLCSDYGKRIMLWAIPFLFGFAIDLFTPGIGALIGIAGFIVLLCYHIRDIAKNGETRYKRV